MINFTFLTEEQIFDYNRLYIFGEYGTKCIATDFSILLGAYVGYDCSGWWWSKSSHVDNSVVVVNIAGSCTLNSVDFRNGGARPALPYSSISSIISNKVRGKSGILEVEYGEYPQTIVSESFARTLERAYLNGTINKTGKSYTTDSVNHRDKSIPFQPRTHIEYEYKGRKYIRFVGDSNCTGSNLSDGRIIQFGGVYWVKVEPIRWIVHQSMNIAVSKKNTFLWSSIS